MSHPTNLKIVQVTDSHLYADPEMTSAGVPTRPALELLLKHVQDHHSDLDALIMSGDLVNEDSVETYQLLGEMLAPFAGKYRLIPGNHDFPEAMFQAFGSQFPEWQEGDSPRRLNFSLVNARWHILGIDTHWPGEVKGRLEQDQIAWLRDQLSATKATQRYAVIFMHHHAYPIADEHMNRYILENGPEFVDLVSSLTEVKAVACGHIHQEFAHVLADGACTLYGTPSTCTQLRPGSGLTLDDVPPGYRIFYLGEGGEHRSEVVRLPEVTFPAKF